MGLPDILKVHFFLIPMMYVLCLVGFCPGILDIWLTIIKIISVLSHTEQHRDAPAFLPIASYGLSKQTTGTTHR